ncbi:MAG: hypothetical protein GON13_02890 [Nanoarchaeota archaeon]|nr:hypothetical protein [Nanoarchaeota archaeon]
MRKGFIKTTEAIIAILLVFTLVSYLAQRVSAPLSEVETDTTSIQDSVLDMLVPELRNDLKNCDLSRVQYLTDAFKPGDMDSKIEITQISEVKVISEHNISSQNVSFTYNFPDYVDRRSALIYSSLKNFDVMINWVWFSVPIIIQNSLVTRKDYDVAFSNINLSKSNVVNTSIGFYWNNKETLINLTSFDDNNYFSLVNISVRIPKLVAGETSTGYLVFAVNSTSFEQVYSPLGANEISYDVMSVQDINRGDVFFELKNVYEFKNLFLEYKIGSSVNRSYTNISSFNNTGVSFIVYWSDLKPCTIFRYEQPPVSTFYNTKKMFYYDTSTIILELQMWYPWV